MVSGSQCLETPNGLVMASAGGSALVPEGWPMAISAFGPETRRALVLVLHPSAEPYSMAVDDPRRPVRRTLTGRRKVCVPSDEERSKEEDS